MSVLCQFPFRAGGRGRGAGARSSGEGGTYCTTRALGQAVLQLLVKLISSSLHSEDTLGNIQTGTLHSGATALLRGCSRKNIFCQKIFDNFFSFQATEMVLTSKWGRIQQEIQIWADHFVTASWMLVRSPWKWEKMLIQLILATGPSSLVVQCEDDNKIPFPILFWLEERVSALYSGDANQRQLAAAEVQLKCEDDIRNYPI